ncbi:MAG: sulfurtransferase TusA family protein [Bacillota bacterium]|jgi:tRNA 2-thiouridine synthesizing protein A
MSKKQEQGVVVDARGRSCPEPVVMTKRALDAMVGGELTVLVDVSVARDNVCRFIQNNARKTPEVAEISPGEWQIRVRL